MLGRGSDLAGFDNMSERSLIAQRLIHDFLTTNCEGKLANFPIDKQLLLSVRNAHNRYKSTAASVKVTDKQASEVARKRKAENVAELESKRKRLRLQLLEVDDKLLQLNK